MVSQEKGQEILDSIERDRQDLLNQEVDSDLELERVADRLGKLNVALIVARAFMGVDEMGDLLTARYERQNLLRDLPPSVAALFKTYETLSNSIPRSLGRRKWLRRDY